MADDDDAAEKTHCFRLTGEADGIRLTYDLSDGEHLLGAAGECDVPLEMAGVSRRQAILTVSDGTFTVKDLDSKNGTFVNGGGSTRGRWTKVIGSVSGPWCSMWSGCTPMTPGSRFPSIPHRRRSERNDSTTQVSAIARRAEDEPPNWVALLNDLTDLPRRRRRSGSHRCPELSLRRARRRGRLSRRVG